MASRTLCSSKGRHSELHLRLHLFGFSVILEGVGLARVAIIFGVVAPHFVPLPLQLPHVKILHLRWDILCIELLHILCCWTSDSNWQIANKGFVLSLIIGCVHHVAAFLLASMGDTWR